MRTTSCIFLFTTLAQVAQGFSSSHDNASIRSSTSATSATPAAVMDEAEAFSKSTFPIAPENLIARAKEVLGPEIGIGTQDGGECLANDFQFCAAVVGPIPKDEYLGALGTFKLEDSFEIQQNLFGFTVDPMQPNRVWFFDRQTAKHVNTFNGVEATGKQLEMPPQLYHVDFNDDGKVTEFGFYTVDRQQGNTGGLGGAFGYFYGVGKPLPIREAQPFKPSFRYRVLMGLGNLAKKLQKKKED
ncbi:unnamed protein product [Cylindrotheca closterium]|uniref:Plastid lipid-associated protein/fibrillin conserved domain-containing protein n=1 Tax=Cylindrotheca closterium TaxID=2856 RepID=A0AAD2JJY2_9STRA|nr:unnamed protein product [Cylindrotheca closterium]